MARYHAVLLDECGDEFGVSLQAASRAKAYEALRDDYAESRVVQLESDYQAAQRERRQYQRLVRMYDDNLDY